MAANDTRRLRVVVTGDSTDAQTALEQVGEEADQTESKLVALTRTLATWAGRGAIALGAVGAAAVTMGVSTASQLEQVEVGFTTMLGSAQKAQKFMKELQDFAAATPFEFTELVGSAQRFLAMGFAAKDVIPMLTAVGDAVAAMGGSAENVDSVTTALGQMQAKGKVSGEELMQLTEQGIPALKILADSYGKSTEEMSAMISRGMVMSDVAIPALIKGLRDGTTNVKGFGGMMEKQSATMQGKWSTFMDTLQMGLGNFAAKFLPAMKKGIDVASAAFSNFFAGIEGKGKLKGFSGTINEIGLGLRGMIGAFKEGDVTSKGIVGAFETVGAAARGVINAFKDGEVTSGGWRSLLEKLAIVISWLVDGLRFAISALGEFVGLLRENETVAKIFWGTMVALVAITKAHAIATGVQAAGGLLAMLKNLTLVNTAMKVGAALQWAYNGAVAAAQYLQIAGYLGLMAVKQAAVNVATKVATAAQWAWNVALNANPIGLVVAAVAVLVGAIFLLWKHSDTFRNWVLNTLWPSLKKAWDQLKTAFMAVVNAMVAAWKWLKDGIISVWNAIWGFLAPIIAKIVQIFSPLTNAITKIGSVLWAMYTTMWKVIWIGIQIAVKLFVEFLKNYAWPFIQWVINSVGKLIKWLYETYWRPTWNLIQLAVQKVVGWIVNTAVPWLQKAWNAVKNATILLKNVLTFAWNAIVAKVKSVIQSIAGPVFAILNAGITKVKGWFNAFKGWWNTLFDGVKKKASDVMDGVVKAFNKGRDGVKKAWESMQNIAKTPVNFLINDVYNNRIRTLWNKVAEKFGIKTRLDAIKGFAQGGVVGTGYGTKDDQLALLMRGEGVLTTGEMRRLGGPRGFADFRKSLAQYGNGGVVGGGRGTGDGLGDWLKGVANKGKDIFQGIAGAAIKPLVNALKGVINQGLPDSGISGLMRGGAHTILDKMVSWVAGKDKEIGNIGANGISGGYKAMQRLIATVFPGLNMISGFRPGARTLSGNRSYHSMGRAVDYPANRALALWIRNNFGSKTKELITPWNELNLNNGRPHKYTGAVWNQHNFAGGNAHVHWAMDGASIVQPGWFMGYNGTGKPETLVNADKFGQPIVINVYNQGVGNMTEQDARKIRNELLKLAGRNGDRTGLPGK